MASTTFDPKAALILIDMNVDAHSNSVTRIFPRLGATDTTQAIITLLNASRTA